MMKMDDIRTLVIHGGRFHADDLMATAIARRAFPEIEVRRVSCVTEEMKADPHTIIADIGCGEFDHHQKGAKMRPYPIDNRFQKTAAPDEYRAAACGLLFDALKDRIFRTEEGAEEFYRNYLRPIEAQDNAGRERAGNPLSVALGAFNTLSSDREKRTEAFWRAERICEEILDAEVNAEDERLECEAEVRNCAEQAQDGILSLSRYMPWEKTAKEFGLKYVVMPSREGFALRLSEGRFPAAWLDEMPEGCVFIHQNRFLCSFTKKEDAIAAAKLLEEGKRDVQETNENV